MNEQLDLIVLAAGKGVRMNNTTPKQYLLLCGAPILIHTLSIFEMLPYIGTKIITHEPGRKEILKEHLDAYGIANVCLIEGGSTRQESVWRAIQEVGTRRVITHNAVLPFVTTRLINNVVREDYDCVTTVTPVHESICRGGDYAEETLDRSTLRYINSPQSFRTEALRTCHERARKDGYNAISDCELLMHYGYTVRFVPGNETNFKITTPKDLIVAEAILRNPGITLEEML